jgi:hypothetical protein
LAVKIPEELARLSIEDLGLSVRSENSLKSRGIQTFGQLAQCPDKELLKIHNFGKKCLGEIRETIAKVLSSSGLFCPPLTGTEAIESSVWSASDRSAGGWRIPPYHEEMLDASIDLLDLSVRSSNALALIQVSTVRQLLNYPRATLMRAQNVGRKSIDEIQRKVSAYLSGKSPAHPDLDDWQSGATSGALSTKEFVTHILSMLPDRQRSVIADRYGLWDGIAETLQDIGDKLGLTRERIRQIEAGGLKRVCRTYKHGAIRRYISNKITAELNTQLKKWGVISEDEAMLALANGCTPEEADLGLAFLQDIESPRRNVFTSSLIKAESGVYCVDEDISGEYQQMLRLVELSLCSRDKPLTAKYIINEITSQAGDALSSMQLGLAHRILTISPKLSRLRNGTIALSEWEEYGQHSAPGLAEAALRLLGRPAHFREITEKVNSLLHEREGYSDRTIHHSLLGSEKKFIRIKSGTYGLAKWGLKKPPFVKDRIIELLSAAGYPLPLWHLEEKVLEVCNCKRSSVHMTLNLNPILFTRFDGERYGLRESPAT